jgi:hypothetical protein
MKEPGLLSGYSHPAYAASLAELGTPRWLPKSNGWILVRPVPSLSGQDKRTANDAMGCYPYSPVPTGDHSDETSGRSSRTS